MAVSGTVMFVFLVILVFSITTRVSACSNCIFINPQTGNDTQQCLDPSSSNTQPCKTLYFAVENSSSLQMKDIILVGSLQLDRVLSVQDVKGLTVQGGGNTISCLDSGEASDDRGAGIIFTSVSNLKVINVTFEDCGVFVSTGTNSSSHNIISALSIINSTNVVLGAVTFLRSVCSGVFLSKVDGRVEVSDSSFFETGSNTHWCSSAGVWIEISSCEQQTDCYYDPVTQNHTGGSINYLIKNSVFVGNRDVVAKTKKGRGISIVFNGVTFNHSIDIQNCTFANHSTKNGAGIGVRLGGILKNSRLFVSGCKFTGNSASGVGSGIAIDYSLKANVTTTQFLIIGTEFAGNTATHGGAVGLRWAKSIGETHNQIEFDRCNFTENSAVTGAAILMVSPNAPVCDGIFPDVYIRDCFFRRNMLLLKGHGIIDTITVKAHFYGKIQFVKNSGTPLFLITTQINIHQDTVVFLKQNSGVYGGGMALLRFSRMILYSGSQLHFDSNHADELGGAIYVETQLRNRYEYNYGCFLSFSHEENNNDSGGDSQSPPPPPPPPQLTFKNNSAQLGRSIFINSLNECEDQISGSISNRTFVWKNFQFEPSIENYTITTSPLSVDFSLPQHNIAPGESIDLNIVTLDELNQPVHSTFIVTIEAEGQLNLSSSYLSDNGVLKIYGTPQTEFILTLQTLTARYISVTRIGKLGTCPLGFVFDQCKCICSVDSKEKYLYGIAECDLLRLKSYIFEGFWIGCDSDNEVLTGICPLGYCHYRNFTAEHGADVPESCDLLREEQTICTDHRRGDLCGECKEGYSVFFHSENFRCKECRGSKVGPVIYIFAELFPLFLLFVIVMITKLKMTSGLMQSLLLFAQMIGFMNLTNSVGSQTSNTANVFLRIHTFLLGFLNFDFFRLDELSFCLWSGATALDTLAIRYVTTLSAMLLLGLFVLVVKQNYFCFKFFGRKNIVRDKLKGCVGRFNVFHHAVIHGISTFLILSYTQYTTVSFQILSSISLYGEGKKSSRSVVRIQGSVKSLSKEHLPYAIPAILVVIFLILPPPLLLIAYPLFWKIKAKLRQWIGTDTTDTVDTTPWLIRKLLPLIDSFQSVFRDNCRMFAGLLFLWRILLITAFTSARDLDSYFCMTAIFLIFIFTIHTLVRPYKRKLYNLIDGLMLANMIIITLLSWHISLSSLQSTSKNIIMLLVVSKIVFMYAPLIVGGVFATIWLLRRLKLIPKKLKCMTVEEEEVDHDMRNGGGGGGFTTKSGLPAILNSSLKSSRRDICTDDDLFSRASELNTSSYIMTGSEAGFELTKNSTDPSTRDKTQ